ncbi:MAG: hypothetical protein L6Q78_15940 [Bacteroidia bacterium]|nr:hypothetical protein [Bacteroidia bacterium]
MNYKKSYALQGKEIIISVPYSVNSNNTAINTARYHKVKIGQNKAEMFTNTDIAEFNEDIENQINFLQDKIINDKNLFESLAFMCVNHIQRFNRLIITDLYSYLDNTMIIVDSTNSIFHNLINSEEDGVRLRNNFENSIIKGLYDHIWVAKPNLSFGTQPELVRLKDLNN